LPKLPATRVLAATSYLDHACIFGVFTILATVLVVAVCRTLTNTVRALFVVCHTSPPAFSIDLLLLTFMLEPQHLLVKQFVSN
jgi:hypothetical protein